MPSVKISMQAILLEMAAAKEFGQANYEKLDPLTVSMGHPDAFAALASGGGEVASHFSSSPFQNRQLKLPGLPSGALVLRHHRAALGELHLDDDEILRGNPKMVAALLGAMKEATAWIKADKKAAAEAYLRVTKDRMPVEELIAMLNDPNIVITIEPRAPTRSANSWPGSAASRRSPTTGRTIISATWTSWRTR